MSATFRLPRVGSGSSPCDHAGRTRGRTRLGREADAFRGRARRGPPSGFALRGSRRRRQPRRARASPKPVAAAARCCPASRAGGPQCERRAGSGTAASSGARWLVHLAPADCREVERQPERPSGQSAREELPLPGRQQTRERRAQGERRRQGARDGRRRAGSRAARGAASWPGDGDRPRDLRRGKPCPGGQTRTSLAGTYGTLTSRQVTSGRRSRARARGLPAEQLGLAARRACEHRTRRPPPASGHRRPARRRVATGPEAPRELAREQAADDDEWARRGGSALASRSTPTRSPMLTPAAFTVAAPRPRCHGRGSTAEHRPPAGWPPSTSRRR